VEQHIEWVSGEGWTRRLEISNLSARSCTNEIEERCKIVRQQTYVSS